MKMRTKRLPMQLSHILQLPGACRHLCCSRCGSWGSQEPWQMLRLDPVEAPAIREASAGATAPAAASTVPAAISGSGSWERHAAPIAALANRDDSIKNHKMQQLILRCIQITSYFDCHVPHDRPLVSFESFLGNLADFIFGFPEKLLTRCCQHLLILTLNFDLQHRMTSPISFYCISIAPCLYIYIIQVCRELSGGPMYCKLVILTK